MERGKREEETGKRKEEEGEEGRGKKEEGRREEGVGKKGEGMEREKTGLLQVENFQLRFSTRGHWPNHSWEGSRRASNIQHPDTGDTLRYNIRRGENTEQGKG